MSTKELKRVIDAGLSVPLIILTSPLLLAGALLVRMTMGKPILFRQERGGLHGRVFTLYKLRTMACKTDATGQPLPVRHRLTRVGRILRRFSIDELPQLWNVLRGDMSLIGPRPLLATYLPRYSAYQSQRHMVRPGLTGYAQVEGRNTLSWEDKFHLDVHYVLHWSLLLDFRIAAKTVWKVVTGVDSQDVGIPSETEFLGCVGGFAPSSERLRR